MWGEAGEDPARVWPRAETAAQLTQEHDPYRWICGGLEVSYRTLSDFRIEHGAALDEVLPRQQNPWVTCGSGKAPRL
jgi:hypothetical protein